MSKKILAVVMAAAMAMTGAGRMPGQRDIDGGNWGRQRCSALCRSNKNYDLRGRIRRRLISIRRLRSLQNVRKNIQAAL